MGDTINLVLTGQGTCVGYRVPVAYKGFSKRYLFRSLFNSLNYLFNFKILRP